jgi:hypothetical protein
MISNNPAEPQASPASDAETGTALPDPRRTIEVAPGGGGTIYDPSGTDNKPPGIADFDLFA